MVDKLAELDLVFPGLLRGLDDEAPIFETPIPDPMARAIESAERERFATPTEASDRELSKKAPAEAHAEKPGGTPLFKRGSIGHSLGITRIEECVVEGFNWAYAYNAQNELVDVKLLD